jgi:mRNA-degrading endonuclease toxin of MazEF toxin-antitoxin module
VSPALASQRKKLQSELEDARNSLQFFQTSPLYTEQTRQPLVREVADKIAQLEAQLVELGA